MGRSLTLCLGCTSLLQLKPMTRNPLELLLLAVGAIALGWMVYSAFGLIGGAIFAGLLIACLLVRRRRGTEHPT